MSQNIKDISTVLEKYCNINHQKPFFKEKNMNKTLYQDNALLSVCVCVYM